SVRGPRFVVTPAMLLVLWPSARRPRPRCGHRSAILEQTCHTWDQIAVGRDNTMSSAPRFNPSAHRPKTQRLRLGVRGAAGTRKSTFAASLADAGLGTLCCFDTELTSCHLPGSDVSRFDA